MYNLVGTLINVNEQISVHYIILIRKIIHCIPISTSLFVIRINGILHWLLQSKLYKNPSNPSLIVHSYREIINKIE